MSPSSKHYNPHLEVDLEATVLHETLMAYHLQFDDVDGNVKRDWIPKSQISDVVITDEDQLRGTIPQWLAEKKNLV